ncbi:uncharacterized protein LOC143424746 [Xylocopa sonorina]|uniref:uncharacterized protein LOC143424746 n=1 Tax=Xylocopa sonorina TaxID=1818115 RepID=UPI00403AD58C
MYNRPVRHRHRGWTAYRARYGAQSCQRRREEWTYARRITTEQKYRPACRCVPVRRKSTGLHETRIRAPRTEDTVICQRLEHRMTGVNGVSSLRRSRLAKKKRRSETVPLPIY